jgi:hypothetical protein
MQELKKLFCGIFFPALCAAFIFSVPPLPWDGIASAFEKPTFSTREYEDMLAAEKNMATANRLGGLLTDLLHEQKRVFSARNGAAENRVVREAENLLNEAGIYISQNDFDEAFRLMEQAYREIIASLEKMSRQHNP